MGAKYQSPSAQPLHNIGILLETSQHTAGSFVVRQLPLAIHNTSIPNASAGNDDDDHKDDVLKKFDIDIKNILEIHGVLNLSDLTATISIAILTVNITTVSGNLLTGISIAINALLWTGTVEFIIQEYPVNGDQWKFEYWVILKVDLESSIGLPGLKETVRIVQVPQPKVDALGLGLGRGDLNLKVAGMVLRADGGKGMGGLRGKRSMGMMVSP